MKKNNNKESRGELMCDGKVIIRCSTSSTRRVTTGQIRLYIMNGEKERDCVLTNTTYPLSFVTEILRTGSR